MLKNNLSSIYFGVINSSQVFLRINKMKDSDKTLKILQKIADNEGKTLEEILDRTKKMLDLINKPLDEDNRLSYVEELIRQRKIGPFHAELIICNNHILHPEIKMIAEDSKKVLYNEFGIETPDYNLIFDRRLNPKGIRVGTGLTSWINQTISLPSEGLIQIPIIVAHEQGHANHMENSKIFELLKETHFSDPLKYKKIRKNAINIIEGWPSFVSKLYARVRDRGIGINMYEQFADEAYGFMALLDSSQKTRKRRGYHEGIRKFEDLYKRRGIETAKYAAYNLMSDYELSRF